MLKLITVIQWIRKFIREKFHSKNPDLPYYIAIVVALILFVIALNAFVDITEELAKDALGPYDQAVTDFVLSFRSDTLTAFFVFITNLGDRIAYIIITLALTIFFLIKHRTWKFILQTASVLILSTLSNIALKKVINRSRPALEHLVKVYTLSYPSGHAMCAMAFYGFLIYLCMRLAMKHWLRIVLITVLTFLIFSIGLSRIYLGVHYPTDVAAGFIGGLIWVTFCIIVFNVVSLWRKRRARRAAAA